MENQTQLSGVHACYKGLTPALQGEPKERKWYIKIFTNTEHPLHVFPMPSPHGLALLKVVQ